jgi:hypothetical protein
LHSCAAIERGERGNGWFEKVVYYRKKKGFKIPHPTPNKLMFAGNDTLTLTLAPLVDPVHVSSLRSFE